jgi:hypothetical protein
VHTLGLAKPANGARNVAGRCAAGGVAPLAPRPAQNTVISCGTSEVKFEIEKSEKQRNQKSFTHGGTGRCQHSDARSQFTIQPPHPTTTPVQPADISAQPAYIIQRASVNRKRRKRVHGPVIGSRISGNTRRRSRLVRLHVRRVVSGALDLNQSLSPRWMRRRDYCSRW